MVVPIILYVLIPLLCIRFYIWLIRQMRIKNIADPPFISLLIVILNYEALATIMLTSLIWKWSGLASLGFLYVYFLSPFVVLITTFIQFPTRNISVYHKTLFIFGIFYLVALGLSYILLMR